MTFPSLIRILVSFALLFTSFGSSKLSAQTDEGTESSSVAGGSVDAQLLSGFQLRSIGPALMSGRISDITVDPTSPNTWYVAAGSGNLWKTDNGGTTWTPIFDNYPSYSIGCVTLDPSNPNIVWVGTGEDVGGRHVGFGDGVYVSHDAGKSFKSAGLQHSEHISRIVIDPHDSNHVLVAVQGPLWSEGGERGLYRSTDGGATWTCVLSAGSWTGCTDLVMDPKDPNVVYAALHQRHRTVAALLNTGPESGIFRSDDRGATWQQLSQGLPGGDKGKIALAVSPQKPNVVYASIELPNREGGTYRSEDYGASWTKTSDFVSGGTGPHYYQEMWADPHRFDCLYHANNYLSRSIDGGKTWDNIEGDRKHVDNHAIAFHPHDPDVVLCGTDGGVYCSYDFAKTWRHIANLPLTQFYKLSLDYDLPFYHVIGGTQDNNSQYGPVRTRDASGITNADWMTPIGGDGHDNAIDPTNPDIIYCESQQGYIRRFDRQTGQAVGIRPAPGEGEPEFRFNWDAPILISPHKSSRIYIGSNFLHRSDDYGDSWTTISPDLSRGENRLAKEIMGRVHGVDAGYDLDAMSQFGSITSISESSVVEGLIYVGTDDGLIQVTEDGGQSWRKIERIYGVPEMAFVNDIKADRHDSNTVYVCFDHHKSGDFSPYVLRSRDRGRTWESIVADLPERHLVWRFEQDHVSPELMFLGTEFGLFVSVNAGENWTKMNAGIPTIPIRDLAIQEREHDLVCATFGRGFYVLDDYSPLRSLAATMGAAPSNYLFTPRKTNWFAPTHVRPVRYLGDSYYAAANPPDGVVFTVYLADSFKTARDERREQEREAAEAGKDVTIPSFQDLAVESQEELPRVAIEVSDDTGTMLRRIPVSNSKGIQRVAWDLTEESKVAASPATLVAPGTYTARLVQISETDVAPLGEVVSVEVEAIFSPTLSAMSRQEAKQFAQDVARLRARWRSVNTEYEHLREELQGREQLVRDASTNLNSHLALIKTADGVLTELTRQLMGDQERRSRTVLDVPTAGERLGTALFQAAQSLHGPTATSREQVEIARRGVEQSEQTLKLLQDTMKPLREAMDAAGLIWVE